LRAAPFAKTVAALGSIGAKLNIAIKVGGPSRVTVRSVVANRGAVANEMAAIGDRAGRPFRRSDCRAEL
jgi:hypothetical protein